MSQTFHPGAKTWYASDSPSSDFSAVFEDDGDTGYLYAYDRARQESPILDAVHIYNVAAVTDKHIPSDLEISWSADGLKAALLINGQPHALIDFPQRCSSCRTGFPAARAPWRRGVWSDSITESF
jgi:hypothetical protein